MSRRRHSMTSLVMLPLKQAAVQGLVALAASAALAALVKASVIYLICFLAVAAEAEGMVRNVAQTCVMTWMFLLRRQPSARKLS